VVLTTVSSKRNTLNLKVAETKTSTAGLKRSKR